MLIITYASIDDQSILQGRQGWVSQFHRNLEVRMEQLSGERIRIWPHPNPPGSVGVDERVLQLLPQVKTLVLVVSPPFIKSDGCRKSTTWPTKSTRSSNPARRP